MFINFCYLDVAPEKIENIYLKAQSVAQIYVHGDSLQNELVAIVIPDQEHAVPMAVKAGILPPSTSNPGPIVPGAPPNPDIVKISQDKRFIDLVLNEMNQVGMKTKLRGFEMVKAIYIEPTLFSVDNGMLTPTFKVKRNEAKEKYKAQFAEMYGVLNAKADKAKL